jgi:hypothetical protein
MPLTNDEMAEMANTLCNKTAMERFTHPEVLAVLKYMETAGMLFDPNPPEIVTAPRENLIGIANDWDSAPVEPAPFENFNPQPTETPLYEPFPAKPVIPKEEQPKPWEQTAYD